MTENMQAFFAGERLYGDDFDQAEIDAWFNDEREGYADLGAAEHGTLDNYGYHALNRHHGFRHLPDRRYGHALGIGSAYGAELLPVIDRVDQVTILEPSTRLRSDHLDGVPLRYVEPTPTGDMPFPDQTFDLVLCFGVLHHIPNVTHVVGEIGRVTAPGGFVLIREPVISMGDWRRPRPGLTARERGIPAGVLERAFTKAGFDIAHSAPCIFPTSHRLGRYGWGFNTRRGVYLDSFLSRLTWWNYHYHATERRQKVRPTSVFYVLRR